MVYGKLAEICKGNGITIARNLIGPYITSLEMAGCSITLLKARRRTPEVLGCAGQHPRPALGAHATTRRGLHAATPSRIAAMT